MSDTKDILIGSVCVASAGLLWGFMEVMVKLSNLKISQILAGRFSIPLICAITWWIVRRPNKKKYNNWYGDKPYILQIWIRGLLSSMDFTTYYAIHKLPLGDLQVILYQAPLCVVFFGWMLLNETLPKWYILIPSITLTYIGILFVSQPPFLLNMIDENEYESLNIYGIIALFVSVLTWTISVLLIRKVANAHFLQLDMACSGCGMFVNLPIMMLMNHFITHIDVIGNLDFNDNNEWSFDLMSIMIMILFGICAFCAFSLTILGYQYGTATMVSWLEYINIPIGFIYQIYIFNDIPNKYESIGGILVTIGCLLPSLEQLHKYMTERTQIPFEPIPNTDIETDVYSN